MKAAPWSATIKDRSSPLAQKGREVKKWNRKTWKHKQATNLATNSATPPMRWQKKRQNSQHKKAVTSIVAS